MTISIKEKSKKMKAISIALDSSHREIPSYLEQDKDQLTGKMINLPASEDIPLPIEVNIPEICDFLAHTT